VCGLLQVVSYFVRRERQLTGREFGDGWDKQTSTSSAKFGGPTSMKR